jgi:hypothetical protein
MQQPPGSEWKTQSSVVACKEFSGGFFVIMPLSILTTVAAEKNRVATCQTETVSRREKSRTNSPE